MKKIFLPLLVLLAIAINSPTDVNATSAKSAPSPVFTCESLQGVLDYIWCCASVSDKCYHMGQAYNSMTSQHPELMNCNVDKHGCQF